MIKSEDYQKLDKGILKRLTLKGEINEFQAYKIPLDKLRYNIKNDRIASFITQFTDENRELPEDIDSLNYVIEDFIVQSNPDAFKKTKKNIEAIGQIEAAVVLSDGIVIDGNRRFTALRQLFKETGMAKFGYIEAVILDRDKYLDKDIKRLELNIQHAVDEKVDYNPIERLVGIYRDLVEEGHLFTPEEYANETQMKLSKVKEEINIAKLLVEYLEFIQKPKKFHIARQQKIDGPLREIYKIINSKKIDDYDKQDAKEFLFANLLTIQSGDVTRLIRDLRPILEDKNKLDEIVEEAEDILDEIEEELVETEENESVDVNKDTREKLHNISEIFIDENRVSTAQYAPVESLRLASNHVKTIDENVFIRLPSKIKEDAENYLKLIEEKIELIRDGLNAE